MPVQFCLLRRGIIGRCLVPGGLPRRGHTTRPLLPPFEARLLKARVCVPNGLLWLEVSGLAAPGYWGAPWSQVPILPLLRLSFRLGRPLGEHSSAAVAVTGLVLHFIF